MTTLFFMWGFVTVLNDVLVPHLKSIFDLSYTRVMLIQFAFFSAYFIFSIPSAKVLDWIGYKRTIVVGLVTMAIGALLFIPAASVPSYPLFLGALMVLAAGITALQVAANPYVAVLGPAETASGRLNLTQAFNSLGTFVGPFIGGLFILSGATVSSDEVHKMSAEALEAFRIHEASTVKLPYLIISLLLVALAVLIGTFKLPPIPGAEKHGTTAPWKSLFKYRHLVLGCIAIFVYVGAEVSIGSFLINYFGQPDIANLSAGVAAGYVAFYWGGAMIGRFIGSAMLNGIRSVPLAAILGIALLVLAISLFAPASIRVGDFSRLSAILSWIVGLLVRARPLIILCTTVLAAALLASFFGGGRMQLRTGYMLALAAVSTTLLVCISMLTFGHVAMWSILLVGFFNSIMFPSIFTLGIAELGPLTGDGSGLLIMAIVGGAIIPVIQGALADRLGIHHAFLLPIICYLYIVFYALSGSKPTVVAQAKG